MQIDVENIFRGANEHEDAEGGGDEKWDGEHDAESAPHPRPHLQLQGFHPRLFPQQQPGCFQIDRREIDGSPEFEREQILESLEMLAKVITCVGRGDYGQ